MFKSSPNKPSKSKLYELRLKHLIALNCLPYYARVVVVSLDLWKMDIFIYFSFVEIS